MTRILKFLRINYRLFSLAKPNFNAIQYGLSVKKEKDTFTAWYNQLLTKGKFIFNYEITGFHILAPNCLFQWNLVKEFLDKEFKKLQVKEFYFPMMVRQETFQKEQQHLTGFNSECVWAERFGETRFPSPIGLRPTSETIIYPFLAEHLKSKRQLPFRLNQWCNVIRWEGQSSLPLIRSREFLWQEGHTVHECKSDAQNECDQIIDIYERLYKDLFAVPTIRGRKSKKETFAGAEYSLSLEALIPEAGKAVQACTAHHLAQNFSKIFDICFTNETGTKQFAYQNCWGLSTRGIGIGIMVHSDNRGIVQSPRVSPTQVLIVPCGISNKNPIEMQQILEYCCQINEQLLSLNIRSAVETQWEEHGTGFCFHQQEFNGIPIRIEVGPKEFRDKSIVVVKRNTCERISGINTTEISKLLDEIHWELFQAAQVSMIQLIEGPLSDISGIKQSIQIGKFCKFFFCTELECEIKLQELISLAGTKVITIMENNSQGKCVVCNLPTREVALYGSCF